MTITIIGTGYVGLTSAAIFAAAGHTVYALDINEERLAVIREGRSFFFEANLDPLIASGIASNRLIPTSSYEQAIPSSDLIFSCVGTPDNADGSSNLSYVFEAAETCAKLVKNPAAVFIQKSTVPVGTGTKIEARFKELGVTLPYVSNPEFLREGTALVDSLWFDRVVVGGSDAHAKEAVTQLYQQVASQRDTIAAIAGIAPNGNRVEGEYIQTNLNSAELIKVTANAFLATKISFANSIAKLADAAGADIVEVMNGVGADARIGRAFLNAGRGYGGGCFPKDVSGLISSGNDYGVSLDILHAVTATNESMVDFIISKATNHTSLSGKKVAVLGLSFKAGTSDVRKSPAIRVANQLSEAVGATVVAYDNVALEEQQTRHDLAESVTTVDSLEEALSGADAVFVATDWPEFISLPAQHYSQLMSGSLFVDCMNRFSPHDIKDAGLQYIGIGRS